MDITRRTSIKEFKKRNQMFGAKKQCGVSFPSSKFKRKKFIITTDTKNTIRSTTIETSKNKSRSSKMNKRSETLPKMIKLMKKTKVSSIN